MIARRFILLGMWLPLFGVAAEYEYHLTINAALTEVSVRAHIAAADSLAARDGRGSDLIGLATCDGRPLQMRGRHILIPHGVNCVRYQQALTSARRRGAPAGPEVAPGTVVTAPSQWLWLPTRSREDRVLITLALPGDSIASVPWPRSVDGVFELPPSPASSRATAVFGDFRRYGIDLPGGRLDVALLDGPGVPLGGGPTAAKILSWLEAAANDVVTVSGAFPNPSVQVIVQPGTAAAWGLEPSPVPFGYVIRDGGEAVRFFVDPERPLQDFLDDWTATHEFSHLLLPFVRSKEKWISEGFASYFQNVLLARRGAYSELEAWQRLHRSFRRAGEIPDPPALRDIGERPFWEVRMLLYWTGAAVALLADTELRRSSGGRETLGTVLGRLQDCCLPSDKAWRGRELFARLDSLSSQQVFVQLFDEHMATRGMPNLEALYADLGIVVDPGDGITIHLTESAPLAGLRRAIMTAPTP
jgi:hypothetical protein